MLIVSPGFPQSGTGNRFCTVEFFEEAHRVLTAKGVVVLLLPAYGASSEYYGGALLRRTTAVWKAMRTVFGEVRAVPVAGHLLAGRSGPGTLTFLPTELGARIDARGEARPRLRIPGIDEDVPVSGEDYFAALFGGVLAVQPSLDGEDRQEGLVRLASALSETSVPANRDGHPVAVAESLATGQEVAQGGTSWSAIIRIAAPVTLAVLLVATGVAAALGYLHRRAAPRQPLLICAAATGLFGMAVEVLLLHAYQNVRGYVYSEVGGLIACFMAGLALGAHVGTQVVAWRGADQKGLVKTMAGCILSGVLLCVLLPFIWGEAGRLSEPGMAAAGFWVLMLVVGFLDGLTFPPLVALFGEEQGRAGGWAYASDLVGAGAGALLCGAIWLPAFGVWGASLATAGILALAGFGLYGRATR
jgi:spermidine synthase